MIRQRNLEYSRKHSEKRKAQLAELKEKATAGDEEATAKLAEHRAYHVEASTKSYRKMCDEAAAGDPAAISKREQLLQYRRDSYHNSKNIMSGGESIAYRP